MAKPIEPTPVLKGDDAYEFVAEMEKQEKASAEEKARVAKGASFIQSLLTFTFELVGARGDEDCTPNSGTCV